MIKTKITIFIVCLLSVNSILADEISKKEWLDSMSTVLPTAFCESSQFFRQCYKVTAKKCEEVAASATRVCITKHGVDIPALLQQPKDGTHWGTVIGTCAGTGYGLSLMNSFIDSKKCKNIDNWR